MSCPLLKICPFYELYEEEEAEPLIEICHESWEKCFYYNIFKNFIKLLGKSLMTLPIRFDDSITEMMKRLDKGVNFAIYDTTTGVLWHIEVSQKGIDIVASERLPEADVYAIIMGGKYNE